MPPTIEHFIIYIPGVLLVGFTLGFMFGAKSVRAEHARMKRRSKE
jgi:hypothetical protein